MTTPLRPALTFGSLLLALAATPALAAETSAQAMPETMDMLRHAIAYRTEEGKDQVPAFARYLADKLEAAGFAKSDIEIIPVGHTAALFARYPGSDKSLKPILLSAHMDVVAANPADWQRDPFTLVEENGYLYGRGVADMKSEVIALVETMMRFKRERFVPRRTIAFVFSGDEETDMATTRELARRYHDAEFLLNADAGGGTYDANLKPVVFHIQAAEKTYADFLLTVTSPGGHSSEPDIPKNAIYRLAKALDHIAAFQFPVQHNEITLASLKATGEHDTGPIAAAMREFAAHPDDAKAAATLSADPAYVGQIRTTCVATMLDGGHALNALPQRAEANINCRIFPGTPVAAIEDKLKEVIADPSVQVTVRMPPPVESPASPLRPDLIAAVTATIHERFADVQVVPGMSSGATDSMYFRNAGVPGYGVSPEFSKPNDTFAHGLNEKLLASEIPAALDYWHSLLSRLAQ
jgi:acetylornithine deacetylase/succinyl-diaminopimelate desuccinylase-like protein